MLIIRNEQLEAFRQYALAQFINDMSEYLRAAYPRKTAALSEAELQSEIKAGIEHAAKYNARLQYDVQQFLSLRMEFGPNFDSQRNFRSARMAEILNDEDLSATEKMDALSDTSDFSQVEA